MSSPIYLPQKKKNGEHIGTLNYIKYWSQSLGQNSSIYCKWELIKITDEISDRVVG